MAMAVVNPEEVLRRIINLQQSKFWPTWHSVGSSTDKQTRVLIGSPEEYVHGHTLPIKLTQIRYSVVVFNCWNGLTNGTLVVPIFHEATTIFHHWVVGGGVRTPADGIVNQKHSRWDRIAVGCCGGFDLRVSTPHDNDSTLWRQAWRYDFHEPSRQPWQLFFTNRRDSHDDNFWMSRLTHVVAKLIFLNFFQKGPNRKKRTKAQMLIQITSTSQGSGLGRRVGSTRKLGRNRNHFFSAIKVLAQVHTIQLRKQRYFSGASYPPSQPRTLK